MICERALNPQMTKVMRGFTDPVTIMCCDCACAWPRVRLSPLAQNWAAALGGISNQSRVSPTLGARARLSWDLVLRELRRDPWAPTNCRWVKHYADLQNYFKYLWGRPKKWQSQFQNHAIKKYMSYQKLWLWMKMRYLNFLTFEMLNGYMDS